MKALTITQSKRAQTTTIVVSDMKVNNSTPDSITVSAPILDTNKNLLLTFSREEIQTMMLCIEAREKEANAFMGILKGDRKPSTPSDNGSTGSLV